MADDNQTSPIELQKHLRGLDDPADEQGLVAHARKQGAPDDVSFVLEGLPEGAYRAPTAVPKAVSGGE